MKAANVASVPQLSPFRYPGGKTWLVPEFRHWLVGVYPSPRILIEPFLGGGICSLTAVFENLVERAVIVENDPYVAAVWHTILSPYAQWLADKIVEFEVNEDAVVAELACYRNTRREMAFQTVLRNRMARGGVMAPGAGIIRRGENDKGLLSRWYPETLAKRIMAIHAQSERFSFVEGDGVEMVWRWRSETDVAFFIDPPYTASAKSAGRRLYMRSDIDHGSLFDAAAGIRGNFMMTYDDAPEIRAMVAARGFAVEQVAMTGAHNTNRYELVITRGA